MQDNEQLVRVVMGELTRQPALAKQLFGEASERKRALLLNYLGKARDRKLVRADVDMKTAVALLQSMVLSFTLRKPFLEGQVTREDYF